MKGILSELIYESSLEKFKEITKEEIKNLLETPANPMFGDYSLPCFYLAKVYKMAPKSIAEDIEVAVKSKDTEGLLQLEEHMN